MPAVSFFSIGEDGMGEKQKNRHSIWKAIGTLAVSAASAYGLVAYQLFQKLFDLKKDGRPEHMARQKNNEEQMAWLRDGKRKDAYIQSFDGLSLHALLMRNHEASHRWVILAHGYRMSAMDMLDYMMEADRRGYNVLAFDQRGCGLSQGRYCGFGWLEHYDLISWCSFLGELDVKAKIALIGVGMGANAVMNAAGDFLPASVKCAVEDSGFSDAREQIVYLLRHHPDYPSAAYIVGIDFLMQRILHFSLYAVSTRRQLLTARIPLLFIHGEEDRDVPACMMESCYEACAAHKERKVYAGCGHLEAIRQSDYFDTLFTFIEKTF